MWSPEREAEAPTGGDPAGLLPPEWEEDEERMSFLFSAFKRSRESRGAAAGVRLHGQCRQQLDLLGGWGLPAEASQVDSF
ncbi:CHMP7 isoform 6 [Pan troglodytes]|uniref:CHMP7 isoform 6 n=1 Tax=Pan troglodytes TaxID=9598 RepID=A0A2J8N912_PANTR|nr:CHMP7 isoform 6 [Pan troglodytes]